MKYTHLTASAGFPLRIAVLSDFHSCTGEMGTAGILEGLKREKPDLILSPGDIFNGISECSVREDFNISGLKLLEGAAGIAPVFYSIGNHELGMTEENRKILESAGITVLDNEFTRYKNLIIAGLTSGYTMPKQHYQGDPVPSLEIAERLRKEEGYKILLCHHPEYRDRYLKDEKIHLIVSGHAHGGQWRFGSRGVYAPGQGLFPRYVGGLYPGKHGILCVSRGMRNTVRIPRFFNPCEIVILDLK